MADVVVLEIADALVERLELGFEVADDGFRVGTEIPHDNRTQTLALIPNSRQRTRRLEAAIGQQLIESRDPEVCEHPVAAAVRLALRLAPDLIREPDQTDVVAGLRDAQRLVHALLRRRVGLVLPDFVHRHADDVVVESPEDAVRRSLCLDDMRASANRHRGTGLGCTCCHAQLRLEVCDDVEQLGVVRLERRELLIDRCEERLDALVLFAGGGEVGETVPVGLCGLENTATLIRGLEQGLDPLELVQVRLQGGVEHDDGVVGDSGERDEQSRDDRGENEVAEELLHD